MSAIPAAPASDLDHAGTREPNRRHLRRGSATTLWFDAQTDTRPSPCRIGCGSSADQRKVYAGWRSHGGRPGVGVARVVTGQEERPAARTAATCRAGLHPRAKTARRSPPIRRTGSTASRPRRCGWPCQPPPGPGSPRGSCWTAWPKGPCSQSTLTVWRQRCTTPSLRSGRGC